MKMASHMRSSTRIGLVGCVLLVGMLLVGTLGAADPPVKDVAPGKHPNIAAAQRHARQAWERILDAQKANEWDLGGHAQKAKDLLDQANAELKLAAETANQKKK